jgi:isoquinoline 1-oxidoreductase alpha subunit
MRSETVSDSRHGRCALRPVRGADRARAAQFNRGVAVRAAAQGKQPIHQEIEMKLEVNGEARTFDTRPDTPLLWVLRDVLHMTGTKFGCGMALCGACTVHVDGQPVRSCITQVSTVAGKKITTIEAAASDELGKRVQAAWLELGVPQCGYCQSGQIMSAIALLKAKPKPQDADIDAAMSGNICRCGTYPRIRAAIKRAAGEAGS